MFTTRYFVGDLPVRTTGFKETLLKVIGAIRYPVQARRWTQFLNTHPLLEEVAESMPGFAAKIYKPYYSTRLHCADRVDLLIQHYGIMLHAGFGNLVRQTLLRPITIYSFAGKSNATYRLELSVAHACNQNGELGLRLMMGDVCVYTITFILTASSGATHVNVGSLKGILASAGDAGIKQITRDLHGCRPRDLMVALVREVGGCLGCATTILIGNANKIMPTEKYFCKKSSDYDRIWTEMHAAARSDGDFELPCTHVPLATPDPLDIPQPANHSLPTKRSALIDEARRALRTRLRAEQAPRPAFPPASRKR